MQFLSAPRAQEITPVKLRQRHQSVIQQRWAALALAAILLLAGLLALRWVFLVPIFQSPDEPRHLDYAFSIFSAGRLINGRERSNRDTEYVHPYTRYLIERTGFHYVALNPTVKISPEYGSPEYFRGLDRDAPGPSILNQPRKPPYIVRQYPFGPYALVAVWLGLLSRFSASLVVLFFGARILSVLLLLITLTLVYASARQLRAPQWLALLLTACTGFFPMVTMVFSYVQPDNVSFTVAALCIYLSLRLRRPTSDAQRTMLLVGLGWAVGFLLICKFQHYVCVLLPILGLLTTRLLRTNASKRTWATTLVLLFFPTLIFGLTQLWVTWGASAPFISNSSNLFPGDANTVALEAALAKGGGGFIRYVLNEFASAFQNYYIAGQSYASYWGLFGWVDAPLSTGSATLNTALNYLIRIATLSVLALTLVRLAQITARLMLLIRQGKQRLAAQIACADPVVNSYFLFTVFMFSFYIYSANSFNAQGRNWLPYMLATFLVAVRYAPSAIPWPTVRKAVAGVFLGGLICYCLIGSYFAIPSLTNRYYAKLTPLTYGTLGKLPGTTTAFIETINERPLPDLPISVERGSAITIKGWAVDGGAHLPAGAVVISIDGAFHYQASYGDDRADVVQALGTTSYQKSGFQLIFPTAELSPGRHYLTIQIVTRDLHSYYESPQKVAIDLI